MKAAKVAKGTEGWTLKKSICKGTHGELFLSTKEGLPGFYCTKTLERRFLKTAQIGKNIDREFQILKEANHPNIIKLIEKQDDGAFIYLSYPFCNGGNLRDALLKRKRLDKAFTEEEVQHVMKQICSAVKYLHEKKILHRKLSLEHVMLIFPKKEDKEKMDICKATIKLINFSFARHFEDGVAMSSLGEIDNYKDPGVYMKKIKENSKVRDFMPYEYDEKVDIWSLGVLCYEILTGTPTFDSGSPTDLLSKAQKGSYSMPSYFHNETVSFITSMLQLEENKRATATQLCNHPFLTNNVSSFHDVDTNVYKVMDNNIYFNINASK